jgi:hypothetical protein
MSARAPIKHATGHHVAPSDSRVTCPIHTNRKGRAHPPGNERHISDLAVVASCHNAGARNTQWVLNFQTSKVRTSKRVGLGN